MLTPFEDLLSGVDGTSLPDLISELSDGAVPSRVLTTGFGAGGLLNLFYCTSLLGTKNIPEMKIVSNSRCAILAL